LFGVRSIISYVSAEDRQTPVRFAAYVATDHDAAAFSGWSKEPQVDSLSTKEEGIVVGEIDEERSRCRRGQNDRD
jgi:hypothetical protein